MSSSAEIIAKRQRDWERLEAVMGQLSAKSLRGVPGPLIVEFSELYRRACADLAMAEQYRLSPAMVDYLHALVGQAHNAFYRSRRFQFQRWIELAFNYTPRTIFRDSCVHVVAVLFFGLFILSAYMAYNEEQFPKFAETVLGPEQIQSMESSFSNPFNSSGEMGLMGVAFYIQHNTGIGFQCFALGPLIIPGLFAIVFNAVTLGASFGYMSRTSVDSGDQFLQFVTAHGAFELTAIALAAAAGLRIGVKGWLFTNGLTRLDSLAKQSRESLPALSVAGVLFLLAALTEGLLSPTAIPYVFKAAWLIMSSSLLMFYFVVLGYPEPQGEIRQD